MEPQRTRRFELPGTHELSKAQDAALALPLDGQHLIIGGPGTGKSVVALLRAQALARNKKKYCFLVYNQLLDQSNRHLFGNTHIFFTTTWMSWFWSMWRQLFNAGVPTKSEESGGAYSPIDWVAVERKISNLPENIELIQNPPYLVIDEGQDMPPAFYKALTNLGFENFYVVADQHQQITEYCSSRQDIETALDIESTNTVELDFNYRNTHTIALLAQHFYCGDPASPPPKLPPKTPSIKDPALVCYSTMKPIWDFDFIATRILQLSDRQPRKLIGIITPNDAVRRKFCDAMMRLDPELDHGKPPIQTYFHGHKQRLNFGQGGIMIINTQSCKGLEFDIVFLADIDQHWAKEERLLKSLFYVMVARAREQVFLLRSGPIDRYVENILPEDANILARR
jgi:superfamily I DNA/RNA helicase